MWIFSVPYVTHTTNSISLCSRCNWQCPLVRLLMSERFNSILFVLFSEVQCCDHSCPGPTDFNRQSWHALLGRELEKVGTEIIHSLSWNKSKVGFNPLTPTVSYGDTKVVLTFGSVDENLQCDHSNDSSSAVLSHCIIYIKVFYKMKFGISLEFWF